MWESSWRSFITVYCIIGLPNVNAGYNRLIIIHECHAQHAVVFAGGHVISLAGMIGNAHDEFMIHRERSRDRYDLSLIFSTTYR